MGKNNAAIAKAYYTAMGEKNVAELEKYLHPDVRFIAPLAQMTGKQAVLEGTKKFTEAFKTLTIRSTFGSDDQAMVVYELEFPAPVGNVPTAVLMTFHEGLISKIHLFYDARPFER